MPELITLLTIIAISMLIVRAGGIALAKTGLSMESAIFQSQSAFMGVGFTTREAEAVVTHPVRRRIVRLLMLLGFASISGTLGTLVVTFGRPDDDRSMRAVFIGAGILVLWLGWKIRPLERLLDKVITISLEHMTALHILDFEEMLKLDKGYTVATIIVDEDGWMLNRTLGQLDMAHEGVLVLSITRENGVVLGTPASSSDIELGDKLLCYGLEDDLMRLTHRRRGPDGDRDHRLAKRRQRLRLVEERVEDEIADTAETPDQDASAG